MAIGDVSMQTWQTAVFFMLPVLLHHNLTPLKAIKKSAELVTEKWGASVVTRIRFTPVTFLFVISCLIPTIIGFFIGGVVAHTIGAFTTVTLFLCVGAFYFTARIITVLVLFRYANGHATPPEFEPELLKNAFKTLEL